MNMDKNNNSEQRGYQPFGSDGKFGYQPSNNMDNSSQQSDIAHGGNSSIPPKGSDVEDA